MLRADERLFFIHIPKTAGTSLIPLIDRNFHTDEICPAQLWRELVRLPQESLPKYRLFRGHFGGNGLTPFLPTPPTLMTMLRQPVPLAVSTYKFICREPGTRVHNLVRKNNMTLDEFLNCRKLRNKASDKQVRHLSFDLEHDPTTGPIFPHHESRAAVDRWIKDRRVRIGPDQRLERAKAKLAQCAFFGLVERFDESMQLMAHTFGWPPVGSAQKLKVAPKGLDSDELTDALIATIMRYNQLDDELYRWAEKLFDERLDAMKRALRDANQPSVAPVRIDADDEENDFDDLVDRAYAARRSERRLRPKPVVRFTFDEAITGSGWQRREHSALDGTTFCWTGPSHAATLDLDLDRSADARVTIQLINALTQPVYDSFRLCIDGEPIDLARIAGESSVRVLQGVIPAANDSRPYAFTRLTFEVEETISPSSVNPRNDDTRNVGVAVNWVDVRPATVLAAGDLPETEPAPSEQDALRRRRRRAIANRVKARLARLPVIGPRLRNVYLRLTAHR